MRCSGVHLQRHAGRLSDGRHNRFRDLHEIRYNSGESFLEFTDEDFWHRLLTVFISTFLL